MTNEQNPYGSPKSDVSRRPEYRRQPTSYVEIFLVGFFISALVALILPETQSSGPPVRDVFDPLRRFLQSWPESVIVALLLSFPWALVGITYCFRRLRRES